MKKWSFILGSLLIIVAIVVISSVSPEKVYSANVGELLQYPESGWNRYETDENFQWYPCFTYYGNWILESSYPYSEHYTKYCTNQGDYVSFVMYGNRFRVISDSYSDRCTDIGVNIDGIDVGTFSEYITP